MSFLKELINKKKNLRSSDTIFTSITGEKFLEKRTESGELKTKFLGTSSGFVVDEKLDLQVAEILDFLYLSSQDVAQDEDLLHRNGITHVLSLGVSVLDRPGSNIKFTKFDVLDLPNVDLKQILDKCFQFIDCVRMENDKNKILVHCNAGYSRAPTVVLGYLMKTFGYSLNEALDLVTKKRNVKPNDGFMKQLMEFEKKLKG